MALLGYDYRYSKLLYRRPFKGNGGLDVALLFSSAILRRTSLPLDLDTISWSS